MKGAPGPVMRYRGQIMINIGGNEGVFMADARDQGRDHPRVLGCVRIAGEPDGAGVSSIVRRVMADMDAVVEKGGSGLVLSVEGGGSGEVAAALFGELGGLLADSSRERELFVALRPGPGGYGPADRDLVCSLAPCWVMLEHGAMMASADLAPISRFYYQALETGIRVTHILGSGADLQRLAKQMMLGMLPGRSRSVMHDPLLAGDGSSVGTSADGMAERTVDFLSMLGRLRQRDEWRAMVLVHKGMTKGTIARAIDAGCTLVVAPDRAGEGIGANQISRIACLCGGA